MCKRHNVVRADSWATMGKHNIKVCLQSEPQDHGHNCKNTTGDKPRLKIESKAES